MIYMNKKIGILNNTDLYTILENYLENEVKLYNFEKEIQKFEDEIIEDKIEIVIIDRNIMNLPEILKRLRLIERIIILSGSRSDYKLAFKYIKKGMIDFFLQNDKFEEIKEILKEVEVKKENEYKKFFVKDENSWQTLIKIEDVYMVTYDRMNRKSILMTKQENVFAKKSLQEIEKILYKYKKFLRVDRSAIININKVEKIDAEKGLVLFDNGEKSYQNDSAIKELLKIMNAKREILKLF